MTVRNAKIFKFQNLQLLNYDDLEPIADIRAAGSVTYGLSPELAEQMTGPSLFTIETEVATIGTEVSLNIGEYGSDVLKALMGAQEQVKDVSSGLVDEVENVKGTGLFKADGDGVTATVLSADDSTHRSGLYRVKLIDKAMKKLEITALSSPDLKQSEYETFDKKLVKTLTLADSADLDTGTGVNLTGAADTALAAVAEGDAFVFRVYAKGNEAYRALIGQRNLVIPKVKVITSSRTMSDGRWFEVLWYNCIIPGSNFNFGDEFSANEVTGKMIFDEPRGALGEILGYRKVSG